MTVTDTPARRWVFWALWGAGLVLWAASMTLVSSWDLSLSQALVDRQAMLGVLVASYGEWPGLAMIFASMLVLRWARRQPHSRVADFVPLARATLLLALAHPLLVTQSLKLLWGRVRFVNLSAELSNFTPFWLPAGVGAGTSFPSGHVAMSMVPSPLPFFFAGRGRALATAGSALLVVLIGVTVSLGRIVAGKHYLTDTVFSFGFALLLAPLLVRFTDRIREQSRKG